MRTKVCAVVLLVGCGGDVVVDAGQGSSGHGSNSTGQGASSTSSAAGSGSGAGNASGTGAASSGCGSCAENEVCLLGTGACVPRCEYEGCDACSPGSVCHPCATSSCPGCDDCIAACLPKEPGGCDNDDPCPAGQVCEWQIHQCGTPCTPDGTCPLSQLCAGCGTSSCCGCKDCLSICVDGER